MPQDMSALTRQSGLMREMQVVANNIANLSTTGFRREGVVFAEHVKPWIEEPSLSMAHATGRIVDLSQAGLSQTGGTFDFAIQGDGFFLIETPRATADPGGQLHALGRANLVTPDGHRLLDAGRRPRLHSARRGRSAWPRMARCRPNGEPISQVGLWQPTDPLALRIRPAPCSTAAR
jgi:flagellar basal-body rod protein FlgF